MTFDCSKLDEIQSESLKRLMFLRCNKKKTNKDALEEGEGEGGYHFSNLILFLVFIVFLIFIYLIGASKLLARNPDN
jgi:hypothetical protein